MGCARFIWNAKCGEDKYLSTFARKYMPIGTYAPIDQKFSQYKDDTLSPWLSECPSQILRNSAVNWFQTYRKFLKGECGKPQPKKKSGGGSIHLTKETFEFQICDDGVLRLFIGSKTNNIGYLQLKYHASFKECAACNHTHSNNRKSQSSLKCESCGHTDHADRNAAEVIKQRAIKLMLHPGTGLSKRGVLLADTGRGAKPKPCGANALYAPVLEASKKKRKAAKAA